MSKNIFFYLGIIIGGVILSAFLSKIILLFLPEDSKIREALIVEKTFGFSPIVFNLEPFVLTLGLQIKISFLVLLGIAILFFIVKKFFK